MDAYNFDSKDEVIAAAIAFVEEKATYTAVTLESPSETQKLLKLRIGDREREIFCVLYLNAQHGLIEVEELFAGTIDGAAVYPREIAKAALAHNAAAVILGHNHPSGTPEPSAADRRITERITSALGLLDIRVLDHVIVSTKDVFSFAEGGLM
ncbi:MAG: DNA repair protein RadC [Halioglobus sp.]